MTDTNFVQKYKLAFPSPPSFGFDLPEGWNSIFENFLEKLEQYLKDNNIKDFQIDQVKEKYAQIRVYHNMFEDRNIENLIMECEKQSMETCQICGKPGKWFTEGGWNYVRCESCM